MRGLPIKQRAQLMWKAATGLFDQTAATAAQGLLAGIFRGTRGTFPDRNTEAQLNSYNTSPWVRACAGLVADSISSTHWRLFVPTKNGQPFRRSGVQLAAYESRRKMIKSAVEDGEMREVENHLLLDLMRQGFGNTLTGQDVWWLHSTWLDLCGDAFYIKQRNALGVPATLWPIPPHWVSETPTPSAPTYRIAYRGFQRVIPMTEVLWGKNVNPVNPYWRGTGIIKPLDDDIDADEAAVKHVKSFFKNNARPDVLVMPKEGGTLTPDSRNRLESWWNDQLQGYWRAYKPLFLTGPMDVKLLEQNFQALQMKDLRAQEADTILQVWRIPPELFGRIMNSNRSTIDESLRIFGQMVLVPRLERMRYWLQQQLVPEYDAPLILEYDSPVPEDKAFALNVMKAQPAAFQLNEFRRLANQPPDPALEGEYAAQPASVVAEREDALAQQRPAAGLERLTDAELKKMYEIMDAASKRLAVRR